MVNWNGEAIPQDIDIEDHPEGGANALNINRLVEIALLDICIFFRFFLLWKDHSCCSNSTFIKTELL